MKKIDSFTKKWIRNEADEKAAWNGCWFDADRAAYVVWWIERYCRLYEGEYAGEPLILRGAVSMPLKRIEKEWEYGGRERSIERLHNYMECYAAGERCDWQYECMTRLFGWVKQSKRWKREVRRFRKGSIWVPKKSKKSPTLAALGLYMLAGEGEHGQKVFLGAKDGNQIRQNVSLHTFQMLEQSPELSAECKRNKSMMSVFHVPTASLMIPLSSGSAGNQKSKEGLNGSVLIDETHVVDREFINRISRAGISRVEPLFMQFSTAGNDPDSYGHEEFEYGEENNRTGKNEAYFYAFYGADQKLTPEELAKDPVGIITKANPALGHTIELDEVLADYHDSCQTIAKLADFMMYRLNVWQRSSNPWLRPDDWVRCGRSFKKSDLLGQLCGAGLDLGKTDDMSSLSLAFPEDPDAWGQAAGEFASEMPEGRSPENEEQARKFLAMLEQPVKLLTWYWIPEDSLERYEGDAPYREWVRDGWLQTTSTTSRNTVDPTEILQAIREIFEQYDVRMFCHDPWYAGVIVDSLINGNVIPEDYSLPFAQTIQRYAWPCALFERMVLSGNLHHDGNPITTWEAGHVQVKEDANGNIRPVKPPRNSNKKIDGIVSGIMSVDATTRLSANISVYDSRGILSV